MTERARPLLPLGPLPREDARTALGLFLLCAAMYCLTSSGRIDIIDGQHRFEVAHNLLTQGSPAIEDPELLPLTPTGKHGRHFSYYGIGGSAVGVPLIALGQALGNIDTQRFFFAWTSPLAGAALCATYYLVLRALAVSRGHALGWAFALGYCSIVWPVTVSVFDQVQHALILLLAVACTALASARCSRGEAALGGVIAGSVTLWQPAYAIVAVAAAVPLMVPRSGPWSWQSTFERSKRLVPLHFLGMTLPALAVAAYNVVRYGSALKLGGSEGSASAFGSPLVGASILLASPGKSIFLYSPLVVLGLWGIRGLWRRHRPLALGVVTVTLAHFLLVASLAFPAGDWCWGPRYLVVTLPLLALAMPFAPLEGSRRGVVAALATAGLLVQLLAISLDHQRYFLERGYEDHFWRTPSHYFSDSQLVARPFELMDSAQNDWGAHRQFRGAPYPDSPTYALFGPPLDQRRPGSAWMAQHAVLDSPRPWPLWMSSLPSSQRPVDVRATLGALVATAVLGATLLLRRPEDQVT